MVAAAAEGEGGGCLGGIGACIKGCGGAGGGLVLRGLRGGAKQAKKPTKKVESEEDKEDEDEELDAALRDPLGTEGAASLLDWGRAKERKRRGIKFEEDAGGDGEEHLSDMDDDELDEYITKGVKKDMDDMEFEGGDESKGPDVAGIGKLINSLAAEVEAEKDMRRLPSPPLPMPITPRSVPQTSPPPPSSNALPSQPQTVAGQPPRPANSPPPRAVYPPSSSLPAGSPQGSVAAADYTSATPSSPYPYAARSAGAYGHMPSTFQPQPIPPHLRVPVYEPMPKPGSPLTDVRATPQSPAKNERAQEVLRNASCNQVGFSISVPCILDPTLFPTFCSKALFPIHSRP